MPALNVSLFGKLCIQRNGEKLSGIDAQKVQELFCYLLLNRSSPHSREALATLLWRDMPSAQARQYLRKALWKLQSAIDGDAGNSHDRVLLVDNDWIEINPQADLNLDLEMLQSAFTQTQGIPGRELNETAIEKIRTAVKFCRGYLLEGWYQDWCIYEREHYQYMYLALLDKLMDCCEAHQWHEEGLVTGAQILRYDLARERTHRRMMRLHLLAGDRTAALRQYQRCVLALHDELGVSPASRTVRLYKQIQADAFEPSIHASAKPTSWPRSDSQGTPSIADTVFSVMTELADALHHLEELIQKFEHLSVDRR